MNICIAGSHGFIGSALVPRLRARGHGVLRLVRGAAQSDNERTWTPNEPLAPQVLADCDAVIHLGGEPIMGRWTPEKKAAIVESRVRSTQTLVRAMAQMTTPPQTFLCASAIGFYGDSGERWVDETSAVGGGFLADVCLQWETVAHEAQSFGTRVVTPRIGVVLSPGGGALGAMLPAFRLGLGGPMGGGRQWWSWIALEDCIRAIVHCLENGISGAVNLVAPNPIRNRDFVPIFGRVLGRPTYLPLPAPLLHLAMGEAAEEMLLASQRVCPQVLENSDFSFRYTDVESALRAML